MINIEKKLVDKNLIITLKGCLDTATSPKLDNELHDCLHDITSLKFDFKDLEYISSAGLRIILRTQKLMNKQGQMVICNINDVVEEIFELTGFIDILTIE